MGRITGLDPALILFSFNDPAGRLADTDALFVDIIHTCGGWMGFESPIGHADFYPNGGTFTQPGCGLDMTCRHPMLIIYDWFCSFMYINASEFNYFQAIAATLGLQTYLVSQLSRETLCQSNATRWTALEMELVTEIIWLWWAFLAKESKKCIYLSAFVILIDLLYFSTIGKFYLATADSSPFALGYSYQWVVI
jgi:hypothetical protein